MKTVKVVAAIICDDIKEKNKIFATARGYGELKGGWDINGNFQEEKWSREKHRSRHL